MATNNDDRTLVRISTWTPGASPQTTSSPPRFTFQSPRNFHDTDNTRAVPFVFPSPSPLTRLSPHITAQVTKPAVELPPEMWRAVLSHLRPDEVMRVRRVNHLFYAVALDHRFRTLSILDETFDDDEVSKVENNVKTFMRKLGDAARFPQFARRIQKVSICMQHLKALQTHYTFIMANETKTNDADPGAFGSECDFGEDFMDCICNVFAHAITLNEIRLIFPNTPADDEEFELESLQDLWYRVPNPHGLTSLTLQLDVTKLGLLLDLAPYIRAPCLKELYIGIERYRRRVQRDRVAFTRIHALFREVGPTLEKLSVCATIKHLTSAALDNDIIMPNLRRLDIDVMLGAHEPIHAINNNYPALIVLLMQVWTPMIPSFSSSSPWLSSLHLPNLRELHLVLHARVDSDAFWSGTFDAPRLEQLYLKNCFQRSSTPDDVVRLCDFFQSPRLELLEIEVREIDVFLIKRLKAAFPNVRRLGIVARPLRGERAKTPGSDSSEKEQAYDFCKALDLFGNEIELGKKMVTMRRLKQ
ncbi:hypothetical protein PLEOSDRAFT_162983 [Pleurotus ostreatus PC15]|uniref:F-box domain-containing protein n=1 Tax=Pleurotus ostreatus (strain PC15) TaxID=1137138 RepID=A0A067N2J0_PLEO1|nr:hypothetical protein PLEOSDRAFT_162983 [Pleurotus ostreatus PC15]